MKKHTITFLTLLAALMNISLSAASSPETFGSQEEVSLLAGASWTAEAEDAQLLGTAEIGSGCENASMGEFVKTFNTAGNGIRYDNVVLNKAMTYDLVIDYFQAADSRLELIVNDVNKGEVFFPKGAWCYEGPPAQLTLQLEMNQGVNTLEMKVVSGSPGPFLDKLEFFDPGYTHVATTYYISDSEGDDANDGMSEVTPLKTLARISSISLGPGDSILFKADDTFNGRFMVGGSGNRDSMIVITRYGDGAKPVLDGSGVEGGDYLATIQIQNQSHIKIHDLEITNERFVPRSGVSDALAYGIYVYNNGNEIMENFLFKHLDITDIFAISIEGVEFNNIRVSGIVMVSERNTEVGKEKHIRDVVVDSCYFERSTRYGISSRHMGGDAGVGNDSLNRNMNFVFTNNHFLNMGGSCIVPSRTYNGLLQNNIFENPGSGIDPRMANRGSGAWFWSCQNILAQYNKSYHVRGGGDSYGMHIDFGNENVILQYNYSEDSEGGFCEILGDNINSVYRFNVSVNDGIRDNKGNSIWISDYSTNSIRSNLNYVYNNTIYVDANITPDISLKGADTYIYNNIFCVAGVGEIGQQVTVDIEGVFEMSNNLYFGNVSSAFRAYDAAPVIGDPLFDAPGATNVEGYQIGTTSPALTTGKSFPEPPFPEAGKGIFAAIPMYPEFDLYGNPVNVRTDAPSIGAFNGNTVTNGIRFHESNELQKLRIYPNPVKEELTATMHSILAAEHEWIIHDLQGRRLQSGSTQFTPGENRIVITPDPSIRNGIYVLSIVSPGDASENRPFVLAR